MTTINTTLAEMRKRNPPQSVEAMILAGETVTEERLAEVKAIQATQYINRERIPVTYLEYCDGYVKLCGRDKFGNWNQEPTQRVFSDWLQTFEEWKQAHLTMESIQAAFVKANSDQGFPVGRPGALTTTAIALKTKLTANTQPAVNTEAIAYTKQLTAEKYDGLVFVPRPANLPRPSFKGPTDERKNR